MMQLPNLGLRKSHDMQVYTMNLAGFLEVEHGRKCIQVKGH